MGELIAKSLVKRDKNCIYYVKEYDKEGNLGIWKAIMARGGRKKKK